MEPHLVCEKTIEFDFHIPNGAPSTSHGRIGRKTWVYNQEYDLCWKVGDKFFGANIDESPEDFLKRHEEVDPMYMNLLLNKFLDLKAQFSEEEIKIENVNNEPITDPVKTIEKEPLKEETQNQEHIKGKKEAEEVYLSPKREVCIPSTPRDSKNKNSSENSNQSFVDHKSVLNQRTEAKIEKKTCSNVNSEVKTEVNSIKEIIPHHTPTKADNYRSTFSPSTNLRKPGTLMTLDEMKSEPREENPLLNLLEALMKADKHAEKIETGPKQTDYTLISDEDFTDDLSEIPMQELTVDKSLSKTKVMVKLHNGQTLKVEVNNCSKVVELVRHIAYSTKLTAPFKLSATNPNRELSDMESTIEEQGIANSIVYQRLLKNNLV